MDFLRSQLLERLKLTALVNLYSFIKLPLLAFITPEFVEFTEKQSVVKVRLGYRTRNHLNVMYFGALAMGAELSVAGVAVDAIQKSGEPIDFIFKDFEAKFLKRADGHVLFTCTEVAQIRNLIEKAKSSSERSDKTFTGSARIESSPETIMTYRLTLSVKKRTR
jgi:hypothetical protein